MNREILKILIIAVFSVSILFMTYSLLYGDSGDSEHFSRPVTPEMLSRKAGNNKPPATSERSFSDQFMPPLNKLQMFNHRSFDRKKLDDSIIPQWSPDPKIHYYILEMKVREDIDYK